MTAIMDQIGYRLLRLIAPRKASQGSSSSVNSIPATLEQAFGSDFFNQITGKVVIDFGCGRGFQVIEMAQGGAQKVIGIDIQEANINSGAFLARQHNLEDRCIFATDSNEQADVIISKDSFEHFSDPAAILQKMRTLLKPSGYVLASFGPTWFHPYGGHLFSVFPWSHLIFSENAQILWRSEFKDDGAKRFSEVAGGLNQLTIRRFEQLVNESGFYIERLETVPIKKIPILKHKLLREVGSSIVRCRLNPKSR